MPSTSVHDEIGETLAEAGGGPTEWGLVSQEWKWSPQTAAVAPQKRRGRPPPLMAPPRNAQLPVSMSEPLPYREYGVLSPKSPTSPFSPLKAAVDRFYVASRDAAAPVIRAGANIATNVRRKYVFRTMHPHEKKMLPHIANAPGAALEFMDISPKQVAEHRKHAVDYFRSARDANARYMAYKQDEARKKAEIRAKSLPTAATAQNRLQNARFKLAAMAVFNTKVETKMSALMELSPRAAPASGMPGSKPNNSFLARLAVKRLENAAAGVPELQQKRRIVEVEEDKGGISRGVMVGKAAVLPGRHR
jgi:hypothetical protein